MAALGTVIELALWFYLIFLLARLVADWVQSFARSWTPRGPLLVVLEAVYSATDPPIRLVRRIVPPLRFGGMAIDLSIYLVLIVCYLLLFVNGQVMPIA